MTEQFAKYSPRSLLTKLRFWGDNLKFIIILLISGGAIYVLFPLTYPKSDNELAYLAVIIHIFAVWGIWVAIKIISRTHVEHAYVIRVETKSSKELEQVRVKGHRTTLDKVEHLLPDNPTPKLAMPRLFQHIVNEAKDHRFESSIVAMQPYREEAINDIFKLQNIQKIALQLGILGTFVGLIIALSQLKLSSDNNLLILQPLFDSLHIAFSTSVAGLEVASIIGLLIMLIRQKQNDYFQEMETATDSMISLAQNAINESNFLTGFNQVTEAIKQSNKNVYAQTKAVELQTEEIQKGMEKLANTKLEFKQLLENIQSSQIKFLNNIEKSQNEFSTKMMKVYEIFSPEEIRNELNKNLNHVSNEILNNFNKELTPSLQSISKLNTVMINTHDILNGVSNKIEYQTKEIKGSNKNILKVRDDFYNSTNKLITEQEKFIIETIAQFRMEKENLTKRKNEIDMEMKNFVKKESHTIDIFQDNVKTMSGKVKILNEKLTTLNEVVNNLIQLVISKKPLYQIIYEKIKIFFNK